jgi:RhtB (resistance to homoserine/threonine) family protein|tara:strand:+ start:681 stop:1313 length:633 start_codon:yes stop_codon:yes gene_type:complete
MDLAQGLVIITTIHLLAAASPGPDFVLVSQQTLTHGKKAGLLCSIGIALGLSVHIMYSAFGLAVVIANSSTALWVIKILGGGYLLYLGYKGLRSKKTISVKEKKTINRVKKHSDKKSIAVGFICNALNPKAPIYFVALFTVVLTPNMPLYQIAIYGIWMMCIQLAWFSTVVFLLSRPIVNEKFKKIGHWIDRVFGVTMIALGLKILMTKI